MEDVNTRLVRIPEAPLNNLCRPKGSSHGGHVRHGGRELCSGYGTACLGGRLLGGLFGRAVADQRFLGDCHFEFPPDLELNFFTTKHTASRVPNPISFHKPFQMLTLSDFGYLRL